MSAADCPYCAAPPWDCICGDANEVVARSPSGYPINAEGHVLTHLCTPAQRLAIYEALIPRVDFTKRQAGEA